MRYKILFIFLVSSTFSWAQTDSIDVNDILNKLKKLEELKAKDVTVNSLKKITEPVQEIAEKPLIVQEKAKSLKSDSVNSKGLIDPNIPQPIITFEQDSLGVGNLVQGDVVKQKFVFKNTGNKTLYVVKIIVDCGCTEPEWTQDPIEPGESGHIIATYDSKDDVGKIQKSLTVVHNSGNDGLSYLMFTGFVAPKL